MNEIGLDFRATKDLDIVVIAENVNVDFSRYDCIYVGTPVWFFNVAPAIRTLLLDKISDKEVALFYTHNGFEYNFVENAKELIEKKNRFVSLHGFINVKDHQMDCLLEAIDIFETSQDTSTFSTMYKIYGQKADIVAMEAALKAEWKRYLWSVFKGNKWSLEIIDPKHGLTTEDVRDWVDKKITAMNLPIKQVKDEWLPYQGDTRVTRKYIDLNPALYLEA